MSDKMCNECKRCDGDLCTYFDNYSDRESTIACILFDPKKPTVFDHITESVESLAEEIVYPYKIRFAYGSEDNWQEYWTSPLIENFYPTRNEAIATTIKKLKKEWKR